MRYWWLLVALVVFTGCELTATGQAIRDVQDGRGLVKVYCPIGTELRVDEMGGLPRTCYNSQFDILEVAVDVLQHDIIGIKINIIGENDTVNISYIPKDLGVVVRYEVPDFTKLVGRVDKLLIFPISKIEGDVVVCESYPLQVHYDLC